MKRQTRVPSRNHFGRDRGESSSAPQIISARVIHPDENFGGSTLRVGSSDPRNAGLLQSLSSPLLDTTQRQKFAICGVNHTARPLSRFQRYNVSNSTQVITDGGDYLCMSTTTINRSD